MTNNNLYFGYMAFYNSKKIEIYANSLFAAKEMAIKQLKVPKNKQHMVTVILCEKDGKDIIHKELP